MVLGIVILLALAPSVVSFKLLIAGAIDGTMLVMLPIASLAYLAVLGFTYVTSVSGTGFTVLSFVAKFALLNVGIWCAGIVLLLMNMRMGP
jgi:hypothetical protein